MPAVALLAILLQTATSPSGDGVAPAPSTATRATAVRAKTPVVIDGRDDDEVWRVAPAITQFREFQPKEDGDPRFATEAKVAYDDRYLYVFIRAFDPHPDSILKLPGRRVVAAGRADRPRGPAVAAPARGSAVRGDEERVRTDRQHLRPLSEGDRRRRPEVRAHPQPHARRDGQP